MYFWCSRIFFYQCQKQIQKNSIIFLYICFCNNLKVFTVTFDKCNASLLHIHFYQEEKSYLPKPFKRRWCTCFQEQNI